MSPHWLDEVFENGADGAESRITSSPQWKDALSKAQTAFDETKKMLDENPRVVGASPAQAARQAFIEALQNG